MSDPQVRLGVEVDAAQGRVVLAFDANLTEPVKVRAFLDEREAGQLAMDLVKAATAIRDGGKVERREVVIPRPDAPIAPRTPRHKT